LFFKAPGEFVMTQRKAEAKHLFIVDWLVILITQICAFAKMTNAYLRGLFISAFPVQPPNFVNRRFLRRLGGRDLRLSVQRTSANLE